MARQNRTVEQVISRLASRAHGVANRAELLAAGVSRDEIRERVESGFLIVVFPGVYRVGHTAFSADAWYMAAVKACGPEAVLSGLAAAWLWGLVKGGPPRPEVTAPTERRIEGIKTKRRRQMDPRDATRHRGIPVTTVPATLVRLPSLLSFDDLAKATHEAQVKYATKPSHVDAVLARWPRSPGAARVRAVIRGDAHVLLGRLERGFRARLVAAGLPLPITNKQAGSHYVDCRWPGHKLTVELDSYAFHNSRHSWEKDHERNREARRRGDRMRRYTWKDVFEEPDQMLAELRELLAG